MKSYNQKIQEIRTQKKGLTKVMKTTQNLMLKNLAVMPVPKDKIKCKKYTKNLSINIRNNFTGFHFLIVYPIGHLKDKVEFKTLEKPRGKSLYSFPKNQH